MFLNLLWMIKKQLQGFKSRQGELFVAPSSESPTANRHLYIPWIRLLEVWLSTYLSSAKRWRHLLTWPMVNRAPAPRYDRILIRSSDGSLQEETKVIKSHDEEVTPRVSSPPVVAACGSSQAAGVGDRCSLWLQIKWPVAMLLFLTKETTQEQITSLLTDIHLNLNTAVNFFYVYH